MKFRKKPVMIEAIQLTPELFWDCYDNKKMVFDSFSFSGNFHPGDRKIGESS